MILLASDREPINAALNSKKAELGLTHEIKWQYVDPTNVARYAAFMEEYFSFVASGRLRVRIMFTQNINVPTRLTKQHHKDRYYFLYYQFIKHAFGISACNPNSMDRVYFQIFPDALPGNAKGNNQFKRYVGRVMESRLLRYRNLHVASDGVSKVDSSDHVILQGLDVILGSMCSRLNEKLKLIPKGARKRGKRTVAREKLYKSINKDIRRIYLNFNVGVNTACPRGAPDRWDQPYRHWLFKPVHHKVNLSLGKRWKPPPEPT